MVENVIKHCLHSDIYTSSFLLSRTYLLYCGFKQNCCQHSISILIINRDNLSIALISILDYPCSLLTFKYYTDNNFAGNHNR